MTNKKHEQDSRIHAKAILSLTITGPQPALQAFASATSDRSTPTRQLLIRASHDQKCVEDLPDNVVLVAAQTNMDVDWPIELSELHSTLTFDAIGALLACKPQISVAAQFKRGQRTLGWLERWLDGTTFDEIRFARVSDLTTPIQEDANRLILGAVGRPYQVDDFMRALLAPEAGSPVGVLTGRVVSFERPTPERAHFVFDVATCPLTSVAIEAFYWMVRVTGGGARIFSPSGREHVADFSKGVRTTSWRSGIEHDGIVVPPRDEVYFGIAFDRFTLAAIKVADPVHGWHNGFAAVLQREVQRASRPLTGRSSNSEGRSR